MIKTFKKFILFIISASRQKNKNMHKLTFYMSNLYFFIYDF